jgi:hypothetical protein
MKKKVRAGHRDSIPIPNRVIRGANTSPAASPPATHTVMQNGQVTSSPTAWRTPVPRGLSLSSDSPAGSSNRVTGVRNGLITAFMVINRTA